MKRKHMMHVLVILVLVCSLLIGGTTDAFGKYTNDNLSQFQTLAFVNFSPYTIVGTIIVDDGGGGTIKPGDLSDSVWGAGDQITDESTRDDYGWEDFDDIAFTVVNHTDQPLYITFEVVIALPDLIFGQNFHSSYEFVGKDSVTGETMTHTGHYTTGNQAGYDPFVQISTEPIYSVREIIIFVPVTYKYYLYSLTVNTNLRMEPGHSYDFHFHMGEPEGWGALSRLATDETAYYSVKITPRSTP